MEKPYSIKDLGQKIADQAKADGLAVAEEAVEKLGRAVYVGFKSWAKESADLSENKVDDICAKFLDYLDPYVEAEISKLDLDHSGA